MAKRKRMLRSTRLLRKRESPVLEAVEMSDPATVARESLFQHLAPEILQQIWFQSENFELPRVSRIFHRSLISEEARVRFCSHVFYHGNPTKQKKGAWKRMSDLQNSILAAPWFTSKVAERVEARVLKLQEPQHLIDVENARGDHSMTESDAPLPVNKITCTRYVDYPQHLLDPPWIDERMALLCRIFPWDAKTHYHSDQLACRMREAIAEDNEAAVDMFHDLLGVKYNHSMFQVALEFECGESILQKIIMAELEEGNGLIIREGNGFIIWKHKRLCRWAVEHAAKGNRYAKWLVDTDGSGRTDRLKMAVMIGLIPQPSFVNTF